MTVSFERTTQPDFATDHFRGFPPVVVASAMRSPSSSSTTRPKTNCECGSTSSFLLEHIPKHKPKPACGPRQPVRLRNRPSARGRKLLDKDVGTTPHQRRPDFVLRQLEKILHPEKLAPLLAEHVKPE